MTPQKFVKKLGLKKTVEETYNPYIIYSLMQGYAEKYYRLHSANTPVSGSLPFAKGYSMAAGYCDVDCEVVQWEDDECTFKNICPIGCGTVWKKAIKNKR